MVIMPMEEYLMPMGTLNALKYQDQSTRQAITNSIVMVLPDTMNYENVNSLRDFLTHFFSTHAPEILLFDLSNVHIMDSRGLGVILYAIRTAAMRQIKVMFCGRPNHRVADLISLAKLKTFNSYYGHSMSA